MKLAQLIHNPTAGAETYTPQTLVALIESFGFKCIYTSSKKKNWKKFDTSADFLIIGGGDGTVKKVADVLLSRRILDKQYKVALLPLGTANNIGKTLKLSQLSTEKIIQSWKKPAIVPIDAVQLSGLLNKEFFLEAFGFGIFPHLMNSITEKHKKAVGTPEEELQIALEMLLEIAENYKPKESRIFIDGKDYSGEYLMAEVMNIQSIGPNLVLNPKGLPGDGILETVLIAEKDRKKLVRYIKALIKGKETPFPIKAIRGRQITMSWLGADTHADDEVIEYTKEQEVTLDVRNGILQFILPKRQSRKL